MPSFNVLPNIKTYIPWCCREFADSGAALGDDGVVGSLGGTYIVTCTMPYTASQAVGVGDVTATVELFDGFDNFIRSISLSHKTGKEDTIVLTGITVAPESATFKAAVIHTFDDLYIFASSHIEICYLAPPSIVSACGSWTTTARLFNQNSYTPSSTDYIFTQDSTIIEFSWQMIGAYALDPVLNGFVFMYIDGVEVARLVVFNPGTPTISAAGTKAVDVQVLAGQVLTFDVSKNFSGDMTATATLPGERDDDEFPWRGSG